MGAQKTLSAFIVSSWIVLALSPTWTSSNGVVASVSSEGEVSTATVPVTDSTGPPPPSGVWFEEDWDYGSTTELLANLNGWLFRYPNADITLQIDPTAPWPSQRAFMVQMTSTAGSGGLDISFPRAAIDRPREIWQETYIKFSPNWRTDFGGSGNPDHKTILWFDQRETGATRWSFKLGVFGRDIQVFPVGHLPRVMNPLHLPSRVWDGNWHRIRVHFKMGTEGNADGVIEAWIDNTRIVADFAVHGPNLDTDYFNKTALGRNLNQMPDQNQAVSYGRTLVWISDPEWN